MLTLDSFLVRFLKWTDITPKCIKLVKGGLQIKHLLNLLSIKCSPVGSSLGDRTIAILRSLVQSLMNRAARLKRHYNHSRGTKSFLQRQHELADQRGHSIDRVELFKKTHDRDGQFVSSVATDAHNQIMELQSYPTLDDSQPLSGDEICKTVVVNNRTTQKVLVGAQTKVPTLCWQFFVYTPRARDGARHKD
ncbi:CACTA en-spm transposon protein [Cucumis melo var. makuwa]|uniref:CACTA en-spm transposon protein n=1 Tax=Cucumis melo var. makuwa TaxID=1194695 RepID=A0A5D3BVY8_CUCMM|nr:CACTA en-spm transposon protein [Cucumis melo var. makuwa]TYK03250.1 CACTA en-spm transposon protein [Cucumis melo var. makuwa]